MTPAFLETLPMPLVRVAWATTILAAFTASFFAVNVRAAEPVDDIVSAPLSPEESRRAIVVRPGFTVELVAHEPLVVDPVAFAWDAQARLWVVEMHDYPLGLDGQGKPGGRVKVLTDDDGDGRYDRATTFLEGLKFPTAVFPWRDGALVCAVPEILFARDTDGDGRADERRTLYAGLHVGNPQHLANGLRWGQDGWIHCANGATKTAVKSVLTGKEVDVGTRDFRIQPETGDIEPLAGRSQYLRERDDWGNWFGSSNSNPLYHFPLEERYLRRNPHATYPLIQQDVSETPGASQVFPVSRTVARFNDLSRANRFTSACSAAIYRDEHLGPEFYGNSFVCEPVHNLVHREILTPQRATFTSRRPADEARTEFLASSDNWFRPSMVRTGPDGALWIADMYRLVIEHPEWIPKEWQAKLDLRAGSDKGRIYRVFPTDLKPWPMTSLHELGPKELVAKLESGNGTVRDLAMQLLVERYKGQKTRTPEVGKAADALHALFRDSPKPTARLDAMCTLALLDDELDTLVLRKALADAHPAVRRWALRLVDAEFLKLDKHLLTEVITTADDSDTTVRLQAICTLGDIDEPRAREALAGAINHDILWAYSLEAGASSLNSRNLATVATRLVDANLDRASFYFPGLFRCIGDSAIGLGDYTAVDQMLRAVVEMKDASRRVTSAAQLLDAFGRRGMTIARRGAESDETRKQRLADFDQLVASAGNSVLDAKLPENIRVESLALLCRNPERTADDLRILGTLLTPQSSETLQTATVAAVARCEEVAALDLLVSRWTSLAPARKSQILDACLARKPWTERLLDAVDKKRISSAELDATRTQALLNHSSKELRTRAAQVLAATVNIDRRRVIDEYQSAVSLQGDAARGREAFTRSCANCHKLGEVGHAVGPDLAALSDRRPETLLVSVLDPNRAVESKYLAYTAETSGGLTFTGLLLSEGTNDVTLALADGRRQAILRSELELFASTAKSFMPEGLEKDLPPQKLADVLAFVASTRLTPKTFAGNTPQVVKPEALRGEFYLLPEHAEIFGPTLVFEPKFSNLGYWKSTADRAEWELDVAKAGTYDVWLEYALPPGAGGEFVLEVPDARLRGRSESTGSWDRYRTIALGPLTLAAGRRRLVVRADGEPKEALFDLKSVRVKPRE
ncbi:MAG: dehydrogenase [Pirellula sp.]|nr:dehydrogenase [Pirellula sp.]